MINEINDTTPNPVRYYEDGRPYVLIEGVEISERPFVDKLAQWDRLEKYILPALQAENIKLKAAYERCIECPIVCVKDAYIEAVTILNQAKELRSKILPEGFSFAELSDGKTLAVFHPDGKRVVSQGQQYFSTDDESFNYDD